MIDLSPATVETVRDERDRLLGTLSITGDAVISTDTEGGITDMNPAAESLTAEFPVKLTVPRVPADGPPSFATSRR